MLTLVDALRIGAHASREYQTAKEGVFETALALDLENDAFRHTWAGTLESLFQADLKEEVDSTGPESIGEALRNAVSDSVVGAVRDFIQDRIADLAPADGEGGGGTGGASTGTGESDLDRETVAGVEYGGLLSLTRRFKNGMTFTGQIGLDLVSLLTQDHLFSRGVFADVTMSIPLMRGSGEFVVTEPLTQAERDVVYALYEKQGVVSFSCFGNSIFYS